MKKNKLIFAFLCFVYIFFCVDCYASLTMKQAEDVASFAEKLIIKSDNEHKDKNGFPLIAYSQHFRNDGMAGKLSYLETDYRSVNVINGTKWAFDCASFASYVYNYTLGINTYKRKTSLSPYTVDYFVNNANHNVDFTRVLGGVKVSEINLNLLQKGDLIIFVGEHIMVYTGDGKIAHVSSSAIKKSGSLGGEVVFLKTRYPQKIADVIRIKNGRINENIIPKTEIVWPDTGRKEDLGAKDNLPNINITVDNKKTLKYVMPIIFSDDKGISAYSINNSNTPGKWNNANNQKNFSLNYEITENGTYYIFVKDNKNQISTKSIVIDFIDNSNPVVNKISYIYNIDNTFNIIIDAQDDSKLTYSIDDIDYKENNSFNNLNYGAYVVKIKDEAGNITNALIDLTEQTLDMANVSFNNGYDKQKILKINFKTSVISYNITNTLTEPTEWININNLNIEYTIKRNGTYYLWTTNKNGVSVYKKIIINEIDNEPPKINKIVVNKSNLVINSIDLGCGIKGYSLDNINYQESSTFTKLSPGKYTIYIKDKCNNLGTYEYNVTIKKMLNNSLSTYMIIGLIIIIITIIYILSKRKK